MVQSVYLRKMNEDEFVQFKEYSISSYAQSLIKAGKCSEKDARSQARTDFFNVLSMLSDENNYLCIAENADSISVGMIWYETTRPNRAFIADFHVYDEYRRMGYGSAILAELERILILSQIGSIVLHVFEHNISAISLYKKCGFVIIKSDNGNIYMEKVLRCKTSQSV